MKLSLFVSGLLGVVLLSGCAGGDGEIAVDASTTPLTAQGRDALFTVRLVAAPDDGYALDGLVVKAIADGKDPVVLSCRPTDTNANAKLEKGESLVCVEDATNQFGTEVAGTEIAIELYAKVDDEETTVGSATWTVAK